MTAYTKEYFENLETQMFNAFLRINSTICQIRDSPEFKEDTKKLFEVNELIYGLQKKFEHLKDLAS